MKIESVLLVHHGVPGRYRTEGRHLAAYESRAGGHQVVMLALEIALIPYFR